MCAQRLKTISCVHLVPHGSGACLFMKARLTALENRLRQTERALVVDLLVRMLSLLSRRWRHGQLVSLRKE